MKSLTLTILVFIISLNGISQLTYVPDDNFEKFIETSYPSANNGVVNDNYVVTSGLTISSLFLTGYSVQISDFTGLQDFLNLQSLIIQNMTITNIDLGNLTMKSSNDNSTWNLMISDCPFIQKIILPHGPICFAFQNLPYLNNLVFQTDNILFGSSGYGCLIDSCNSLTILDISNISNIEIGSNLHIQVCTHLTCVNLKNGKCNKWAKVTMMLCPALFCVQVDDPSFCATAESIKTWQWKTLYTNPSLYQYSTNCNCVTGLSDLTETDFSIAPNPTSSEMKITITQDQLGKSFKLFDNIGREKMNGVFTSTEYTLNLESFETGIYFLKIAEEDTQIKIVKN